VSEKWVIVSAYGPGSDNTEEEIEEFWEALSECVIVFEQSQMIVILGEMNAWIGDMEVEEVIGKFGFSSYGELVR
jgi:hypothetical protein